MAVADYTGDGLPDFTSLSYDDNGVLWIQNKGLVTKSLSGSALFDQDENGCGTNDTFVSRRLVLQSGAIPLDVSSLQTRLYLVRATTTNGERLIRKIIKN